jgi:hypothetical protein
MPTKKRASKKAAANAAAKKKGKHKVLKNLGLNPKMVTAAILTIMGALLVIWNISGLLFVFLGAVLIYFGLKMFGIEIRI